MWIGLGICIFIMARFCWESMPLSSEGDWVFEYEALQTKLPHRYMYLEASAYENIKILGENYFRDLKRTLPTVIYNLEVLNKRRAQNVNKFYPLLSEKMHGYAGCYDYSYYDRIHQDPTKQPVQDSRGDGDCYKNEPLSVSFDSEVHRIALWLRRCTTTQGKCRSLRISLLRMKH